MKTKTNKIKAAIVLSFCLITAVSIYPMQDCSGQDYNKIQLPPTSSANTVGGTMTYDILYANGFVFLYSFDRVLVYNHGNNSPCGSIYFEEQINMAIDEQVEYGKFNSLVYNPRLYTGSINYMAYNPIQKLIYVVKPSLEIDIVDVDHTYNHTFSNDDIVNSYNPFNDQNIGGLDPASFKPMNGVNILKYDDIHNRIYWVVIAHNAEICPTGNFHYRKRFLGLFTTSPTGYPVYHDHEIIASDTNYRESAIADVVFNANNDFYYLVKLNKFEVHDFMDPNFEFEFEITGGNYFHPVSNGEDPYYKFSKLLYINEPGVHLIVALPYRFPSHLPLAGVESDLFVLDGNHDTGVSSGDFQSYAVPSHRITDGNFLSNNNDLIISYAPDADDVSPQTNLGTHHDIAIFHYDDTPGVNSFEEYQVMSTNINEVPISAFDKNVSLKLTTTGSSEVLISKKDELVSLSENNGDYSYTQLLANENCLLARGVSVSGKSFICNPYKSGFEIIYNTSHSSIKTGYPVYHIEADNDGNKLYLYNTLNTYGNGLYICEVDPQGNENISYLQNESCIGDCKYNPYMDHFLVSENGDFGSDPGRIMVVNNDQNNTLLDPITLPDSVQYPKEMYIAPNGRLYVFADMLYGRQPKVLIYAAHDFDSYVAYQHIASHDISPPPSILDEFAYYSGNFCYNSVNHTVYASIHPTEFNLDPYLCVQNSMFDIEPPYETTAGTVFTIYDSEIQSIFGFDSFTGNIICPEWAPNSQYEEIMLVIGKKLYIIDHTINSIIDNIDQPINDIAYSPYHDRLYALIDCDVNGNPTNRSANVFEIIWDGNNVSLSQNPIAEFPGQATSMLFNQYNTRLYIHHKFDQHKLGGKQVRLISFDPDQVAGTIQETDLGLTCFYPELDHNGDFHYYFYNITSPYIDPYSNTIYIPNGGHSCISKVEFIPDEKIILQEDGITWLSFPRLDRDQNGDMSAVTALTGRIEEELGEDDEGNMEGRNEDQSTALYIDWVWDVPSQSGEWEPDYISNVPLENVNSKMGYILDLNYQNAPPHNSLSLEGDVFAPDETIDAIYTNRENWIGYWLYHKQHPLDAISDEDLEHIYSIKGQYWACGKFWGEGIPEPYWICMCYIGKSSHLKYGDMVKVKTNQQINDFQWQIFGNTPTGINDREETEHYTFSEQTSYTPIFIELDSAVNPVEIGAFVEDSCVGATTVLPEDTIIMVPAYTEGISGEIYFDSYYGSMKSYMPLIKEYYVKDGKTNRKIKSTIHTSEIKDYYLVSFKNNIKDLENNSVNQAWLKCRPNPMKSFTNISLFIPSGSFVELILYNIHGREVTNIHNGYLSEGNFDFHLRGKDNNGMSLSRGIYILSLKSHKYHAQIKIIKL